MLGNCATGRLSMVIAPTSTMRIAITIATMGRLMKNFDMGLPVLCLRDKRLGVHMSALAYFLNAFGDDSFARFQSVRHNPLRPNAVADLDRSYAHLILVVDNGYLIGPLQFRYGTLWHE